MNNMKARQLLKVPKNVAGDFCAYKISNTKCIFHCRGVYLKTWSKPKRKAKAF